MLNFKQPGGTSRGVLTHKDSWFIFVCDDTHPKTIGIGESGLLKGLSMDDHTGYEAKISEVCNNIQSHKDYLTSELLDFPSIRFGLEMALMDLGVVGETGNPGKRLLFPSGFTCGDDSIPINGLVWMGTFDFMKKQIHEKIESGFNCIKLKIGAIDFNKEIELIKSIRKEFSVSDMEIRVDANGAFSSDEALDKLKQLSDLDLHSIEQPVRQGQWETMAKLCEKTPLPIALDEELIGINRIDKKAKLLEIIKPQYIILKPSLIGGFKASEEWIELAGKNNVGWWITSALESNIGLNAIAQWTYTLNNPMPQGLGTGQLYANNFDSPLEIDKGKLYFNPSNNWHLQDFI
ncbi:MAG: o-succinylbenzoate synthase [Bacteroidales bacterium]